MKIFIRLEKKKVNQLSVMEQRLCPYTHEYDFFYVVKPNFSIEIASSSGLP